MKKLIAALLVLAMALSVASIAFAADEIDCYEMASYQDGRREGVVVTDLKKGEIISFYVKAVPGTGIDGVGQLKMYVRHVEGGETKGLRLDAEGNVTNKDCYSVWFDSEDSYLWKNDDGWFYIEAQIQKDGANYLSVVTYDEGESAKYPDAQVADCLIAGIKVNGVAVDSERVFPYDGEKSVTATESLTPTKMADPKTTTIETPDETEDVEDTGVVSVAVVAVAAVVGGAVVLKKREF